MLLVSKRAGSKRNRISEILQLTRKVGRFDLIVATYKRGSYVIKLRDFPWFIDRFYANRTELAVVERKLNSFTEDQIERILQDLIDDATKEIEYAKGRRAELERALRSTLTEVTANAG